MKKLLTFLMVICVSFAQAQLTIESNSPTVNSTNVPLNTSISITFNTALDTTYQLGQDEAGIFWNIDSSTPAYYSPDHRTATFDVSLSPNTVYFVCVFYARAEGGAILESPTSFMFTTGSSFPPYSVSGNVLAGSTGASPANAMVLLSSTPISDGGPHAVTGAIADGAGAFVLPSVSSGTFYPVAARDLNGDGDINPENGDVVAIGDPVTVISGNITGVTLTFASVPSILFSDAVQIADSINATLPPGSTLRQVGGWEVDTLGHAANWEFSYIGSSLSDAYKIRVGSIERHVDNVDSMSAWWLSHSRVLADPGSAASSSIFVQNVENNGGREFRTQDPGGNLHFQSQVNVGDLRWSQFGWLVPDTSLNYWGAAYSWGYDSSNQWVSVYSKNFLGNYSDGTIILVTGVEADDKSGLPAEVVLMQNYPNPFNPSTHIGFSLPKDEWTTLKIYNMIGQEVKTLVQGLVPAGQYSIRFDAGNLASGMYFYRLVAGTHTVTNRMILMR